MMLEDVKTAVYCLVNATKVVSWDLVVEDIIKISPGITLEVIDRAISELVQSGEIKRVEYQLSTNRTFHAFYMRYDAKLVI